MAFALVRTSGLEALVGPAAAQPAQSLSSCWTGHDLFGSSANDAAFNALGHRRHKRGQPGRWRRCWRSCPWRPCCLVFGALDGLTTGAGGEPSSSLSGGLTMLGGGLGRLLIREPENLRRAEGNYLGSILYGLRPVDLAKSRAVPVPAWHWPSIFRQPAGLYAPISSSYLQRYLGVEQLRVHPGDRARRRQPCQPWPRADHRQAGKLRVAPRRLPPPSRG